MNESDDIAAMRDEIAQLQKKVDELVTGHNTMSAYIFQFRKAFGQLLLFKWYRFIIWLWPMPMPPYERKYIVHSPSADRVPIRVSSKR
jgi:hypothetical protein